jgi:hypothetical protein
MEMEKILRVYKAFLYLYSVLKIMSKKASIISKTIMFLIILCFTVYLPFYTSVAQITDISLKEKLEAIKGVVEVKTMSYKAPFKEKYLVRIKQWIDPKDTVLGSFIQRVFVSHYSYDAPVVLVTEGYSGSYAERAEYTDELAALFNTNQILVEHRYFGQSVPENMDWNYLTAANAASDHHNVVTLLKSIYTKKWINTGISKGGQTALIHRALYPDDVDISVCYVGPLCFSLEDGRHEPFISCKVASEPERQKVHDFQLEVLKRRKKMMPMFEQYCAKEKYTFRLPLNEIFDYCVLEFSFSFWQWGWAPASIPSSKASDTDMFNYLMRVCSPDYFANEGIAPTLAFFVQAAKELGYYGYETEPFAKYLKIKTAKGYLEKIFLPEGLTFTFDSTLSQYCQKFLNENDPQMIFIYGEYDPWSAAAVNFGDKKNMLKAVCPAESHRARIRSFPKETQQQIIEKIKAWLK